MNPIQEGKEHYLKHGAKYSNPYPPGTKEYNDFERGWSQALKARPELMNKPHVAHTFPMKNTSSGGVSSEAYRNAKKK